MVRPVGDASPASIIDGKAYVTFSEPANVNVDINGQLEDNYTGYGYTGPNVHTITLFANPIFPKPDINNSSVRVLYPNEDINTLNRNDWQTIVFAPGVHDIGLGFEILSNETLYIPGDAVVHGTIHPPNLWGNSASKNFKVFGSGTISGENIVRHPSDDANLLTKPFTHQAEGSHLEGFVVADPAFHTFNMNHSSGNVANPNIYKNLKILAWRINSDGINAFRCSEVSDCFFRTQDDAFYYGAQHVNQHDNVVWNDANGAVLFLQNVVDGSTSTFRDVKVIYHRANWHWWDGGRIVSFRQRPSGVTISNVTVQNILIEDPLPAFPPFYGTMIDDSAGVNITLNNIVIENVHQEHDGVSTSGDAQRGKPQNTLIGVSSQVWENIWFKNCYFNGEILTSFEDGNFYTEYVDPNTVIFNDPTLSTEKRIDFEVKIYPNPVENHLHLEFTNKTSRNIRLYDIVGKLLYKADYNTDKIQIDVDQLKLSGIIYVQVQSGEIIANYKVLVR
ncbi:T9SS type A sorting domain-containing protein [Lutibacter agarilyticus]|nr:T9SS type A sorting domain-containing protein [Lutibacter agarilyticus]